MVRTDSGHDQKLFHDNGSYLDRSASFSFSTGADSAGKQAARATVV
jgi:hypothetical protein